MYDFHTHTQAEWRDLNPKLRAGEPAYEKDTHQLKIGDGHTRWADLSYFGGAGGGTFVDLSAYARKSDLPVMTLYARKADLPDMTQYAKTAELPGLQDLTPYARKSDIPTYPDLSPYAKTADLPLFPDLSQYARKTDLSTPPVGAMGVYATTDAAVADANPQYTWLILDPVSGGTPADTTAPTVSSFTATPGNAQNVLAWGATDNTAVTRYTVVRAGTTVYDGTATGVTDTGLTNGTPYAYTLTAYDAAGNTKTATATATPYSPATPDTTAPTITTFTATPGNGQTALAWAGTDNVAVTRWTVSRGATVVYDGTAISFTDTGLTNGTTYTYTLTAYDAAANTQIATASATPAAPAAGATPSVVGRASGAGTAVNSLTISLATAVSGGAPQAGDDVFVIGQTASSAALSATGFTQLTGTTPTAANTSRIFHKRWVGTEDPATALVLTRASGTSTIQGKAIIARNLLASITASTDLLAAAIVTSTVTSSVTTLTLGPSAVPSQASVLGLALAMTDANNGANITASAPWTPGIGDSNRSMSASNVLSSAAAQTVTLGWTTAAAVSGALLLLKGA